MSYGVVTRYSTCYAISIETYKNDYGIMRWLLSHGNSFSRMIYLVGNRREATIIMDLPFHIHISKSNWV